MSDQVKSIMTMLLPFMAAMNLLLASFGIKPFASDQLNALTLVVSMLVVFVGFIYNHFKHPTINDNVVAAPAPVVHIIQVPAPSPTVAPLVDTPAAPNAPPKQDASTI